MIRFCDREVASVEYNSTSRQELLHYFLKGHLEEIVCIYDDYGYMGYITYHTLLYSISLEAAVVKDVLILDENIWTEAKRLFLRYKSYSNRHPLLPVVDRERNLVSFAYEDDDANRELRQLGELEELLGNQDAVQFVDMYPECDCVVIYGFNELAYFFACYLKKQGILVNLQDAMWEGVLVSNDVPVPDYRCMKIYAEGIQKKPANWEKNLLRTVSVEFECVNIIYEENIRKNVIRDADGGFETLVMKLQRTPAVVILGTGVESQDAYDYLLQNGIDVCCFVVDRPEICEDRLFGKPIINLLEAISRFGIEIIFIECLAKNSAWGVGGFGVDYFHYMGFERNRNFFCLKDYIQLPESSLKTVLKNRKVILAGDYYLCGRLADYLENDYKYCQKICYLKMKDSERVVADEELDLIGEDDMEEDVLCLIVFPEYHTHPVYTHVREKINIWKAKIKVILKQRKICDYSDYFSYMISFVNIEKKTIDKYPHGNLRVKKVVLGSINSHNGNFFFRGLLDGHPSVMLWDEYSYFNNNLFWICIRLAHRDVKEIIQILEQMYRLEAEAVEEQFDEARFIKFIEGICILLVKGERYTSQELFVAFHMAHMCEISVCVGGG